MVFVSPDGRIHQAEPWGLSKVRRLVWGFIDFIYFFFQSLLNMDSGRSQRYSNSRGGPGQDPPGWPRRRMGRINHATGPAAPPMGGGG